MRPITPQLPPDLKGHVGRLGPAKTEAVQVRSYRGLMDHLARLAYENRDHLLFFRGQPRDHPNKAGASSFYPQIYRGERVTKEELDLRFEILDSNAARLCDALGRHGLPTHTDVRRRRYVQWSILQHYEICPTPLLDFTHSPRVACSFAFLKGGSERPFVYVFAMPYITNRISINSEHDIVNVRLLSICPPEAMRPFYQDGYTAGTDEVTTEYDSKDELDFTNRLVAKFSLSRGKRFWDGGFAPLPEAALYPKKDRMLAVCRDLRAEVGTLLDPGSLGRFLQKWTRLERSIMSAVRSEHPTVRSMHEALGIMRRSQFMIQERVADIEQLRRLRNRAVHQPEKVTSREIAEALPRLERATRGVESDYFSVS